MNSLISSPVLDKIGRAKSLRKDLAAGANASPRSARMNVTLSLKLLQIPSRVWDCRSIWP